MARRPLIIDCDPGVDDAIALLLALASSDDLDLLGIVAVAGNVPLALTQYNARRICQLAHRADVPIYAGCPRALLQIPITATEIHGTTGLNGAVLPEPTIPLQSQHGVAFLINQLLEADALITLAVLGPLTNLSVALIQSPDIAEKIDQVVIMGGAQGQGNVTPSAEFNIYADPHAARVVFEAGLQITMLGLELTHQVVTTSERLAALEQIGTPVGKAAADLLRHYGQLDMERYGLVAAPLHDPCVIAYLLQPDLFAGQPMHVAVETNSALCMGRTVLSEPLPPDQPANAFVLNTVDAPGFYQLLTERLAKL
jgi:purine nucleosidase